MTKQPQFDEKLTSIHCFILTGRMQRIEATMHKQLSTLQH